MRLKKRMAGALQFVVVISWLITTVVLSFMLLVNLNHMFRLKKETQVSLFKHARQGIVKSLHKPQSNWNDIDDPGFLKNMIFEQERYGVFLKRSCRVKQSQMEYKSVALLGLKKEREPSGALYLTNNYAPLYVAGISTIEGKIKMSRAGIRRGNLSEKPFRGRLAIDGYELSDLVLPQIGFSLDAYLETLLQQSAHIEEMSFLVFPQHHTHSFKQPTQLFKTDEALLIENTILNGNLIIFSNQKITIDASAQLRDVILIAPQIHIRSGVWGSFQAFATRQITVGPNCQLDYPSVLWLQKLESETVSGEVDFIIQSNSYISGGVAFIDPSQTTTVFPKFVIERGVSIRGEVYSQVPLDIAARVEGTLYAAHLVARHDGRLFSNHLMDSRLLAMKKNDVFAGFIFDDTPPNTIIKWLD